MTDAQLPTTLGALRDSGYRPRTVKDEMRTNLIRHLRSGTRLFPGIRGYGDTVIPQLVNAILARHDFVLLGLRGQAKSRILRRLTAFLDDRIPVIAGSEVNDDPFAPISRYGRNLVNEHGDDTPVAWIDAEERYVEKLATPDVTIADMVGDLDPIRAARGGHTLADELSIHFGLLPRANRGIFAMNELPDLAPRIQVGLFNILEEGDVQIKGFPVRLRLDLVMAFTANPEDYTARGKIVTPLKDRIAAEVRTHYPEALGTGIAITEQEAWTHRPGRKVLVPDFVRDMVERVAHMARRTTHHVDKRSGVSQRMPIALLETVVSNAEQRALRLGEEWVVPRIGDIYASLSAITGKLELEYEGELRGVERVARDLISACTFFSGLHPNREDPEWDPQPIIDRFELPIVEYFDSGGAMQVAEDASASACVAGFGKIPGLLEMAAALGHAPEGCLDGVKAGACELILEALVNEEKISRTVDSVYQRAAPS